jgi:hypothetical protein
MIFRSSVPRSRTLYRVAERPTPFGGLRGDGYGARCMAGKVAMSTAQMGERPFKARSAGTTAVYPKGGIYGRSYS